MFKNQGTSQPEASQDVNGERRHGFGMGRTGGTGRCATSHGGWWGYG